MRVLVFFDLPVETAKQRRRYRRFRKFLLNEGFVMLQESVYSKLAISDRIAQSIINKLLTNRPSEGLVQALKVTEKQYSNMVYIVGNDSNINTLQSMDEFVIL